jgi:hypothetical protein
MMLADIEAFDPEPRVSGAYSKFQCNQPACEGKPHDALHKSLSVNMENGVWHCFRCSAHGVLEDDVFDDEPAYDVQLTQRGATRRRIKERFAVPDPE